MRFNVKAFALTCGIFCGATLCLATLWLLMTGHDGTLISRVSYFYIGYTFSVAGAFVGLVWGFVDGAISGAIFALLYNALAR